MEVRDADARPGRHADGLVQPLLQLVRRLDVVREHEDLLRQEVLAGPQQVGDALHDDACLAGSGARDHDDRPVAPFDDPALVRREG